MMRSIFFIGFVLTGIGSSAQISSTFTSNAEGWTTPNDADGTIGYSATGGNPGGHVFGTPFFVNFGSGPVYFPFYFIAPGTYLGNRSAYYSGTLRYDVQQSTTGTPNQYAEVILRSGNFNLFYYPTNPFQPPAASAWTTFSVPLHNASGFWKTSDSATGTAASEAVMQFVLTALESLEIRGLYRDANTTNRVDNVNFTPPIVITAQPSSVAVCVGAVATLTTAATGNPAITYRWQRLSASNIWTDVTNGGGFSGATTASLSVNTSGNVGAGTYRCRVSGTNADDVFTDTVTITVNPLPVAPTTTGASRCGTGSVALTASGGSAGQYRWYTVSSGGTPIGGQTNSTYNTPSISTTTTYYVAINNGTCESTRTSAIASIGSPGCGNNPPIIEATVSAVLVEGTVILDLTPLLSDPDDNLDISTLRLLSTASEQGATATINASNQLELSYGGLLFAGNDYISVEVCDLLGACTQQLLEIEVGGDIVVFNGFSPNGDDFNPVFIIQYIDLFPDTRENKVSIFNRWGDVVFETVNYDNVNRVFTGLNKNGSELQAGTYFYKIEFASGRKTQTGYISLKK